MVSKSLRYAVVLGLAVFGLQCGGDSPTAPSAPVQATWTSADSAFGADTLTVDPDTGLRWLDVPLSTAFSYDGILVELEAGGQFEGFRLATSDEVRTFFGNAGINVGDGFLKVFTETNFQPIVDLMEFVGVTGTMGSLGGGNFFDFTAGHIESGPGGGGQFIGIASLAADPDPTMTGRPIVAGSVPSNNNNSTHGQWLILK